MKVFLPMDNWPQPMLRLFFGAQTLSWMQRLRLITFLVGNGYPIDALHTVMAHRMRTSAATIHANHVTRDILSGRYDRTWFYFNVTEQDYLYLDNTPYGQASGSQIFTRNVNAMAKETWGSRGRHSVILPSSTEGFEGIINQHAVAEGCDAEAQTATHFSSSPHCCRMGEPTKLL